MTAGIRWGTVKMLASTLVTMQPVGILELTQ